MKNILITTFFAGGLHGGIKYSVELAAYFQSIGYNVYLAYMTTIQKNQQYFKEHDIKAYDIQDLPLDITYDIVWTHHFPMLPYLIQKGLKYKRIINSCISKTVPLERYIWFHKNIDMVLCLSEEIRSMFIKQYDIPKSKLYILPNTAPDCFFESDYKTKDNIKSIAVVSNHAPDEVKEALKILETRGYETIIYGDKNQVDITPDVLKQHDVVITIGKTIQYCLAMGLPVYEYDHFGGVGYITTKNIDAEENFNFSGRGFCLKKSAEQIADEIINQYHFIIKEQPKLQQIAMQRYKLSDRISQILHILESKKPVPHVKITKSNRLFFDYCKSFIETVNEFKPRNEFIPQIQHKKLKFWVRFICCFVPIRKYRHKIKDWYIYHK